MARRFISRCGRAGRKGELGYRGKARGKEASGFEEEGAASPGKQIVTRTFDNRYGIVTHLFKHVSAETKEGTQTLESNGAAHPGSPL